jgi:hypothetical protein
MRLLTGALAVAALLVGCGMTQSSSGTHAADAKPVEVASLDPCTLLNLQQQSELGGINSVQPTSADPPDTACVYVHKGPPSWTLNITVGMDRGSKSSGLPTAGSRPQELNVQGFAATSQELSDGCIVEVQTSRVEGFAVRTKGQSPESACPLATHAANLAATTVRRRN